MFSIGIEYVSMVLWSFTLLFILVAVLFRKIKFVKWSFGALAFFCAVISVFFLKIQGISEWLGRKDFVGQFFNAQTGGWIKLNDDLTWNSNSQLFDCSEGNWNFVSTEDFSFLELTSSCQQGKDFLQISAKESKALIFTPSQTSSIAGNELIFERK